jgi:hypothetical protein
MSENEFKYQECQELANLKYKTMLLKGTQNQNDIVSRNIDISNIDIILNNDHEKSKKEPWGKLDQTIKIQKIMEYTKTMSTEHNLNDDEHETLNHYLLTALRTKRLQRVKDVTYDKTKGEIKAIPCLFFNNKSRSFTLKRSEKRQSTTKSLGLGKTRKNKEKIDTNIKDKV